MKVGITSSHHVLISVNEAPSG